MRTLHRSLFALACCLALGSGLACKDSPPSESPRESSKLLGLWEARNEDYTLEAEFYKDGTFYYFYSDPSELREGGGTWKKEQDQYVLEVDSGMIYLCEITFDDQGTMTIQTESAGTWEFQRAQ